MKKYTPLDILAVLLPHLTIALSLFMITCFIVDRYNRAMAFINNEFTKYTLLAFAILVIVQSVVTILRSRRDCGQKGEESDRDEDSGKDGR